MKFREYQLRIIHHATCILKKYGFVYLAMEVRTGKTFTSLGICANTEIRNVLFVTKKKAISSIQNDYDNLGPDFDITIINYESLHKIKDKYECIILDEAHSIGAFPKPSKRAKEVYRLVSASKCKVILLSGTPTPESYSQIYHQVYSIPNNPFSRYKNFYRFCDDHVNVVERKINSLYIRDYSRAKDTVMDAMKPYLLSYTQAQAGFKVKTTEKILEVTMRPVTYRFIKQLKKNLVVEGTNEVILGDTPTKLMTKLHQMYSGTIKFESGNSMILDTSKAEYIYNYFQGEKIGIFYKFKEEYNALKEIYGEQLTTELEEFNKTDKSIALQIVSGREGISLRKAVRLVYFNIDFSSTSYWQSRDRMTTKDRLNNDVYWIFAKGGIEHEIYKAVIKKKDYTLSHFKRDFLN
tara:strand:+ start:430 stop:1653 length:1224 start_codon:yes stop_codon:yes gene_type:complete